MTTKTISVQTLMMTTTMTSAYFSVAYTVVTALTAHVSLLFFTNSDDDDDDDGDEEDEEGEDWDELEKKAEIDDKK